MPARPRLAPLAAAAAAIVATVALLLGVQFLRESRRVTAELQPPRLAVDHSQAPAGSIDVALQAPGGPPLRGWYVPSRNGAAVLLVHGYGATRLQLLPEMRALASSGFGVLALDLRAHGESGGASTTWGIKEQDDIAAAVGWLTHRADVRPACVGAFGFSIGAMALAEEAARDPRIAAVVLAGGYTDLEAMTRHEQGGWGGLNAAAAVWTLRRAGLPLERVNVLTSVGRISPRPVLVLAGSRDPYVPRDVALRIYGAARQPKSFVVVEGAGHGGYADAQGENYLRQVVSYFRGALCGSSTQEVLARGAATQ